jgi:hypothetical protein
VAINELGHNQFRVITHDLPQRKTYISRDLPSQKAHTTLGNPE